MPEQTSGAPATATKPAVTAPVTGRVEREFTVRDRGQLRQALTRFLRHRLAVASLAMFVLLVAAGLHRAAALEVRVHGHHAGQLVAAVARAPVRYRQPRPRHVRPGDLRGLQQSIKVALSIALIATDRRCRCGAASPAFYRGFVDTALMRFADLILTIPALALAAALANNSGGTWWIIAIILGSLSAPYVARVVRGVVLSLREQEFVEAARALGASDLADHPAAPGAQRARRWSIVNATLLVAGGILAETALSFIGFGVQAARHLARPADHGRPAGGVHPALAVLLPGPVHHPDRADRSTSSVTACATRSTPDRQGNADDRNRQTSELGRRDGDTDRTCCWTWTT